MNQIVWIVMIVVGILFLVISLVLSAREKKTETGTAENALDIEAYKKELEEEMNRLLDSYTRTAQKKLDESAKEALDARVEEAKREIEVTVNEAKEYVEKLLETSQTKMEDCVKQTQEDTTGIADEVKQRIEEIGNGDIAQLKQDAENVRKEIVDRQQETEMLYTLVNDKQNQLIESIEQEQQRAQTLSDHVETMQQKLSGLSFSQTEPQTAEAVPEDTDGQTESVQPKMEAAEELPQREEIAKSPAAEAEETPAAEPQAEETAAEVEETPAAEPQAGVEEPQAEESSAEETAAEVEETPAAEPQVEVEAPQAEETATQAEETPTAELQIDAEEEPRAEETPTAELQIDAEEELQAEETPAAELQIDAEEETQAQQLAAEKEYAESTAFDEVRPRRRRKKKRHFLQRTEKDADADAVESDLTKPIDREGIRDALHAQPHKAVEALAAKIGRKKKEQTLKVQETQPETETEIDIDEVVVADVEELDSIATETVKEALQEVLDEDEDVLGYTETTWEQEEPDNDGAQQAQEDAAQEETVQEEAAQEETVQEEAPQEEALQEEKREGRRRRARRKKKSVVWELSKKEQKEEEAAPAEETPQEESLPEDMIIEDEPNKMLHAVRSSGTVSTEADLGMRANVLRMYDDGHSSMEIAEALKLGIGEVRMIIDLYSRRER